MIAIEQLENRVNVTVFSEFTLADFKEFENTIQHQIDTAQGQLDLIFDLREMLGFTLDVAWEEVKYSRKHAADFRKIAVVTDDQWVVWSAWVSRMFVHAEIEVFEDYDSANAWVSSDWPAAV